jgi:putative spermidine/putrescine transport system permease protein
LKKNLFLLLKLLPVLVPFALLFLSGIILTILQSFGIFAFNITLTDIFAAYRKLFSDIWFYRSFFFSLYVAFLSTLFSVMIGTAFSYFIWKLPSDLGRYSVVYKMPLILPHIAAAFIIVILLGKTGFFSSVLYNLGIIRDFNEFPALVHTQKGFDIILAYVFKEVPFVILMVSAVLNALDVRLIQTASMLGEGKLRIFFRIILPFIFPVISTTFIILFIYSFGAFDIPFVIGASYPGMLSLRIYNYYFGRDLSYRPEAMAFLVLIFFFSVIFIYFYQKLISKLGIKERKL